MKRIFSIIFQVTIFTCLACSSKENTNDIDPGWGTETPTNRVSVMTYNVKYCSPYDSNVADVNRVAEVISSADPDIVFLQELDRNTTRSGNIDQLDVLSKKTDLPFTYYGKAIDYQGGESGLAILSRYKLSDPKIFHLPRVELDGVYVSYRKLITATITIDGKKITVANTHLELTQENRDLQVPEIDRILSQSSNPVILGGDFNATPDNFTMQTFFNKGFQKTCLKLQGCNTISSRSPHREIDYVLYRNKSDFEVISHDVIQTEASDHLPIFTILELK